MEDNPRKDVKEMTIIVFLISVIAVVLSQAIGQPNLAFAGIAVLAIYLIIIFLLWLSYRHRKPREGDVRPDDIPMP